MSAVYNPRFPHRVRVYRDSLDTRSAVQRVERVLLLDSVCRHYVRERGNTRGAVNVASYVLALPVHRVGVLAGDKVEVLTSTGIILGEVLDSLVGNFGANIWYDEVKQ